MADDVHIEFVPFPDDPPSSGQDAAPESPVAAGAVTVPEPEPEPAPESEPAPAPEQQSDSASATEPVRVEAAEPVIVLTPPDADPTAGATRAAAPTAAATAALISSGRSETAPARPGPGRDAATLRTTSISGRLLLVTVAAVVVVALVVLAAVWGVARVSSAGRDVDDVAAASAATAAARSDLQAAAAAPTSSAGALEALDASTGTAIRAAQRWVSSDVESNARAAVDSFVEQRATGPAPSELKAAHTRLAELDAALTTARSTAAADAESARTWAIAVVLAVFVVGILALFLLGRWIGRSVVVPIRSLGRAMRHFGDGDVGARAQIAGDEVGALARSFNSMADSVTERLDRMQAVARRDAQLRTVNDALDLADREEDVFGILEQALAILTPQNPGEMLAIEPASTHLSRVSVNPDAGPGGCPVEQTDNCPAIRRAQALTFESPGAINACPQLRRHDHPCSAVCLPVGVNGQVLGVIHVTGPEYDPPSVEITEQLVTLAGQVGGRVGAQRTLETTRLQASTDGLTGLANRRMLEARLGDLMRTKSPFALAVADVDHFKQLNDNYGHELGDRALQLFAKVLEDNVRGHDLVARFGGEEFVLVYPELTVKKAMEVIERIRTALARAIDAAGLPPFTCSFGVTHSLAATTVDGVIRIADAGLFMAKDLGRNRVVFADVDLAAEVFGPDTPSLERSE